MNRKVANTGKDTSSTEKISGTADAAGALDFLSRQQSLWDNVTLTLTPAAPGSGPVRFVADATDAEAKIEALRSLLELATPMALTEKRNRYSFRVSCRFLKTTKTIHRTTAL